MIEVRTHQDDVTIIAEDRNQFVTIRLAGGAQIRLSISEGGAPGRYHVSADLDRGQAVSFSAHDEDFVLIPLAIQGHTTGAGEVVPDRPTGKHRVVATLS